mmetsp:Transcript_11174/g.18437  ORF Transcript_11174/g.18437 Transcript_11174/m.18437 type:complete len:588 (+) Transcript_11174:138-1901(+)|eukprot:scaffold10378_cov135-Skeletonema_menzelii.AAC.2
MTIDIFNTQQMFSPCEPFRRRRRSLALASVVALTSVAATCSAFTTSNVQQYPPSQVQLQSSSRERRSLLSVLNMVSFLEAPSSSSQRQLKQGRKDSSGKRLVSAKRSTPSEARTIEIDIPDYDAFVFDEYVVTSSLTDKEKRQTSAAQQHIVPDIDSEILFEGISAADQRGSEAPSSEISEVIDTASKVNRSSTMPGFIKDESLDLYIGNEALRRLPTKRKVSRMVRSKAAKLKRRQTNSEAMYRKAASVPDSLCDYAHEIHAISRVTPKEEKELGTKTQEAIRLKQMYDDLQGKYGREPTDEEWCAAAGKINMEALREAIQDGMEAKNLLVASNLRMVQRVVNLYIRNGLGSEYNAGDLMQDGTMALIRAAEKYEPERGFRFSTYAMYWIRSAVKRSQTTQSRIVTVPQRIHETYKRVTKADVKLKKELGREPTKQELATACDISVMQLDKCRKAMQQATFSLDAELQNGNKPNNIQSRRDTMYDIIEYKVDETEHEKTQRLLMKEHLIGTLRRYLSPHEVDLLLLRYGLMDERALPKGMSGPLTIAEVSNLVGLKPDKVRRIIINSQKQLRHLMKEWEGFEAELA